MSRLSMSSLTRRRARLTSRRVKLRRNRGWCLRLDRRAFLGAL